MKFQLTPLRLAVSSARVFTSPNSLPHIRLASVPASSALVPGTHLGISATSRPVNPAPASLTTTRSFHASRVLNMAQNMKDGKFTHNNMEAPKTDRVLPLFSLKGKTAIVSGAGAGIGYAVAQGLAEAGANVAIWYNSNKKAIEKAAGIEKTFGVKCKAYQVNVTSYEAVQAAVDQIVSEFDNRLDIFVANSGVAWESGPMLDGSLDDYRKVMVTNLDGVYFCARAAGQHWRRQAQNKSALENYSYGSFIATASMSGHIANIPQLQSSYNASKAGVIHLCKSLAVEWTGFARANSVSPGYIKTELSAFNPAEVKSVWQDKIPMGREGEPHELKGAFLYLASDAASYTTGIDIIVDGGYCAP